MNLPLFDNYHITDLLPEHLPALAAWADNYNVWINLRDTFPHPYTIEDAWKFYSLCDGMPERESFAICEGSAFIGGIGFHPKVGREPRSAEFGFWLAEPYWGKGIGTAAARAFCGYLLQQRNIQQIFAYVFSYNTPSCRTLEKCGFRKSAFIAAGEQKQGQPVDAWLYVLDAPAKSEAAYPAAP